MLAKYTQSEIKRLWSLGLLERVPKNEHGGIKTSELSQIGYNSGKYGCNAEIYEDKEGNLFILNYRLTLPERD